MQFEWDEQKRQQNIEKHGIDFRRAAFIFDGPILELCSNRKGESRWIAVGELNEEIISVVYTKRGEVCRIISARPSRRQERAAYRALYS